MKKFMAGLVLTGAVISGCSSLGEKKTDEEIVRERTQKWLNALLAKDIEKAWTFTSPAFRSGNDAKAYKRFVAGSSSWTTGEVSSVQCEQLRCEVLFKISYNLPQFKIQNTRPLENVWIKVDGQWWIYQK